MYYISILNTQKWEIIRQKKKKNSFALKSYIDLIEKDLA